MADEPEPAAGLDDMLAEYDQRIAAEVRQLLRARRAGDAKALEVGWGQFGWSLCHQLRRVLGASDPAWAAGRWFDGYGAEPEYPAPGRVRLCGQIVWVVEQERWYYDPFEFDIELCPRTGALRRYVFRFGDHRPLAAKVHGSAVSGVPVGGWAYEIERRPAEPSAAPDTGRV